MEKAIKEDDLLLNDKTESIDNILIVCENTIKGFKIKADHNKNESLICFITIVCGTLITPLFITLGSGLILGKIVPSILSVIAAGFTSWLQLRKPQQLWVMYRSAQRILEDQKLKYIYRICEYDTKEPDKLLAEKIAEVAIGTHNQWVSVVPTPEKLSVVKEGK